MSKVKDLAVLYTTDFQALYMHVQNVVHAKPFESDPRVPCSNTCMLRNTPYNWSSFQLSTYISLCFVYYLHMLTHRYRLYTYV